MVVLLVQSRLSQHMRLRYLAREEQDVVSDERARLAEIRTELERHDAIHPLMRVSL